MVDQSQLSKPCNHLAHRWRHEVECFGDGLGLRDTELSLEVVDDLEVVLMGPRERCVISHVRLAIYATMQIVQAN